MRTKTILIIEDEEPLRILLGELLKRAEYDVLAAAGGQQGLRLARAHRPDLVLCDIRMPEMDGHAVLAEFRRIPGLELVPVVIMTAHAELPDMRRSMNLGADDYVAKPFDNAELLETVARHLERTEQRRREAGQELDSFRRNLGRLLPNNFVTPLHDIIGCASVLSVDAAVMPAVEIRDFAQSIHDAAERLHRQVENFILYTQLDDRSVPPLVGDPVLLSPLIRNIGESLARRHRRLDSLTMHLEDVQTALPREHFAKAVAEVIDNAFRYTPLASTIRVDLERATSASSQIRLVVSDTGTGLPEEVQKAIASNPWRDTSAHEDRRGAGLGLYLSRRLTQAFGGGWTINSSTEGTRVTFVLPT